MSLNITFRKENNFIDTWVNHLKFTLKKDIGDHKMNWAEKLANIGLWGVEKLPTKIWNIAKNPKVIVVALTALALLANSFAFYPLMTLQVIKATIALIPQIPLWALKFSAYIASCGFIIFTAVRALGRLCNKDLMEKFSARHNIQVVESKVSAVDAKVISIAS